MKKLSLEQAMIKAFHAAEDEGDIKPAGAEWGYDYPHPMGCQPVEQRVRELMKMNNILFKGHEWELFCKIGKECAKGLHRSKLHKVLA